VFVVTSLAWCVWPVSCVCRFARTSTHLEHVHRFLQTKLPAGFPVAFSVPIVPSVSARVSFEQVEVRAVAEDRLQVRV
jgi:hypothetical protein